MLIGYETPINYQDVLCMTALIASISLETLADEQQWIYQNAKHTKPSEPSRAQGKNISASVSYCEPEDLKRGFITGGLFRYSRHPNFACEQANWYLFYAFGCIATVSYLILPSLNTSAKGGIGLLLDLYLSLSSSLS
jgi:steroid 5-alpha reductase family enzyme